MIPGWELRSTELSGTTKKEKSECGGKQDSGRCFSGLETTLSPPQSPQPLEVTSLGEEAAGYGAQASDLPQPHGQTEWAVFRVQRFVFSSFDKTLRHRNDCHEIKEFLILPDPEKQEAWPTCGSEGSTRDCQEVEAAREKYRGENFYYGFSWEERVGKGAGFPDGLVGITSVRSGV